MAKLETKTFTVLEYENSSGVVKVPINIDQQYLLTLLILVAASYHTLNGMYNNACLKKSSEKTQHEYAAARSNLRLRSIKLLRTILDIPLGAAVQLVDHAIEMYDVTDFVIYKAPSDPEVCDYTENPD